MNKMKSILVVASVVGLIVLCSELELLSFVAIKHELVAHDGDYLVRAIADDDDGTDRGVVGRGAFACPINRTFAVTFYGFPRTLDLCIQSTVNILVEQPLRLFPEHIQCVDFFFHMLASPSSPCDNFNIAALRRWLYHGVPHFALKGRALELARDGFVRVRRLVVERFDDEMVQQMRTEGNEVLNTTLLVDHLTLRSQFRQIMLADDLVSEREAEHDEHRYALVAIARTDILNKNITDRDWIRVFNVLTGPKRMKSYAVLSNLGFDKWQCGFGDFYFIGDSLVIRKLSRVYMRMYHLSKAYPKHEWILMHGINEGLEYFCLGAGIQFKIQRARCMFQASEAKGRPVWDLRPLVKGGAKTHGNELLRLEESQLVSSNLTDDRSNWGIELSLRTIRDNFAAGLFSKDDEKKAIELIEARRKGIH